MPSLGAMPTRDRRTAPGRGGARRPGAVTVAALSALALLAAPPGARAGDPRPASVPALSQFAPTGGTFGLRADARVVVRRGERAALRGEARTLAADLGALLGRRVRTATRTRTGDVLLTRRAEAGLGAEGYRLRVGRVFTIAAPQNAGVFYGGRTLLQLVRGKEPIARGRGRDVPRYAERGLMVDCGRAFYDRAWWLARIRRMADLKLNVIHLHLSDNQGYRIETPSHPEIVSPEHLTLADVRAMVAEATRRHITLIPEIDMPGHLGAALAEHPELQLRNVLGQRQPDKLDVTLPAARTFAREILADLLPVFPGPWWHLGLDEYLGIVSTPADYQQYPQLEAYADAEHGPSANGKDAVLDFANELVAQVRAAGKEARVWSDGSGGGSAVALAPGVVIEWWENLHSPRPDRLLASGRRILNVGWWPLYYVTGGPLAGLRASEREMYERWAPNVFEGPYTPHWFTGEPLPATTVDPADPGLLGAKLAVWNDDPAAPAAAPAAVAAGIDPRLVILAQQTWGSPKLAGGYDAFRALAARVAGGGADARRP